jgi:hypothetical protein
MNIQHAINEIYLETEGYSDLIEAIAIREVADFKESRGIYKALDKDQTEELAESFKQSLLSAMNSED